MCLVPTTLILLLLVVVWDEHFLLMIQYFKTISYW